MCRNPSGLPRPQKTKDPAAGEPLDRLRLDAGGERQRDGAMRRLDDRLAPHERARLLADLLQRHVAERVGARQHDRVGVLEAIERLAQRAGRQHAPAAERVQRVHQHQVQVAMDAKVLKPVVEQQAVRALRDRLLAGRHAVRVGVVRRLRQLPREQQSFVVPALRRAGFARAISAAEDRRLAAVAQARARDPLNHRRLARAADGDVPDADHRRAELLDLKSPFAIRLSSKPHRQTVEAPGRRQQQQRRRRAAAPPDRAHPELPRIGQSHGAFPIRIIQRPPGRQGAKKERIRRDSNPSRSQWKISGRARPVKAARRRRAADALTAIRRGRRIPACHER